MKKNTIVFGGNSVLAKNFAKNFNYNNITFISRQKSNSNSILCNIGKLLNKYEIEIICDQIKKNLVFKQTTFLLFSWSGGPRTNHNLQSTWTINTNIIINFIEICKIINPSSIVFLSSAGSIYPQNNKLCSYRETDEIEINSIYGYQKHLSEKFLSSYVKNDNLNLTILRISSAYGFDSRFSDQGVINKWLFSVANKKKLELYNSLDSMINFISFDQISEAIQISQDKELNGIYNIGTENSVTLSLIIELIKKITNSKLDLEVFNNKKRFFNLNTDKFHSKTGKTFFISLEKDIRTIYKSILSEK